MSHEFRTPLNAIIGFSEVIKDRVFGGEILDRYVDYADDINTSGRHLLSVVNDVIDLTKVEAGEYKIDKTEVDINVCLDTVINMMSGATEARKIKISTTTGTTPVHLQTDERLTKQVLINLLSNAIKFSTEGSEISITVNGGEQGGLELIVSDHGAGISKTILNRIGEPFLVEQAETHLEGQGAGLGLSIAKRCMEMMGGELLVQSERGIGTSVFMRFPKTAVVH